MELQVKSADRNLLLEMKGELDHHGARNALRELELSIDAALPKKLVLDRVFYAGKDAFAHKPGAAVASARRAGTTASVDVLDKYFTIAQMPVVSSTYWNMVHGNTPEEVRQDAEGMQTMQNLARNLLWMVQCIQAGKAAGLQPPQAESEARTNFIR